MPRICPIGAASGGQPASARIRSDLDEHLQQPIAGLVRAQMDVERGDEPCRKVVLGRPHRDPRRHGRHRLVADVLVDDVRRLPEPVGVDAGRPLEALERLDQRLAGDAMQHERDRIHRRRDEIRADATSRRRALTEPRSRRALDVEADRQPARLA